MAEQIHGSGAQLGSSVVGLFAAIQSARASRWMPAALRLTTVQTAAELRRVADQLHPELVLIEIADALRGSVMTELSMTVAHTAPVPVLLLTQFRVPMVRIAFDLTAIRSCRIVFYESDDVGAAIADVLASGSARTVIRTLLTSTLSSDSAGPNLTFAIRYALLQPTDRLSTSQFVRTVGKSRRQCDRSLAQAGLPSVATICRIARIVATYRKLQAMSVKAATIKLSYRSPNTLRRYLGRAIGRSPSDLKRMTPEALVETLIQGFDLRRDGDPTDMTLET
jgi:DNA-binding phage protein